jgi:hypothetical protein
MPSSKPKPSEIATEAKRLYIPWIESNMPNFPANSIMFPDSHQIIVPVDRRTTSVYPRIAIMDADPVDLALQWYDYAIHDPASESPAKRIPVVNMANERRAGGDWESGFMAPEECFARRSNLVPALMKPHPIEPHARHPSNSHYPIPPRGGMYSPSVGKWSTVYGFLAGFNGANSCFPRRRRPLRGLE